MRGVAFFRFRGNIFALDAGRNSTLPCGTIIKRGQQMEIITRSAAKLLGKNTYFTGVPCKNGHVSYRYVQSGTCKECINGERTSASDPKREARLSAYAAEESKKVAIRTAKAQLVQVKLRLFAVDLDAMKAAAWGCAVMREPLLTMGDVYPALLPLDPQAGTALYKFNCHADDIATLRAIAGQLLGARSADGTQIRAALFGAAAAVPIAPVPEWALERKPGD